MRGAAQMPDFWNMLNAPKHFYTPENISDTIDYINAHHINGYNDIFAAVLDWVRSMLSGEQYNTAVTDASLLSAAHATAELVHDKAVLNKNFIAAVRWRYVMAAISDYTRMVMKKK